MKEAYTQLDQPDLAQDVASVYDLNSPDGPPVPEHKDATFSHKVWDLLA
jgi:outer membrane protein assembly factor BamD